MRVLFADGSADAALPIPRWLTRGPAGPPFTKRAAWLLPEDELLVLRVREGIAWISSRDLLVAAQSARARWVPGDVFPRGDHGESALGEVLFVSDNMTLVGAGTERVLVKQRTGCEKGERVRLLGRPWSGPGAYLFLVRANGERIAIGQGEAAQPEEVRVERAIS